MDTTKAVVKKEEVDQVEQRVRVVLKHPIEHDHIHYSRGLHEFDANLAAEFLKLKCPVSRVPIAVPYDPRGMSVERGTAKPVPW
jgi:hypothetical protein